MPSQPANRRNDNPARLLFIDDEPRVLKSMRATFRQRYQVATATSGREALALLRREPVDVVISDQRMPGMTGVETLTAIRRDYPEITRILLTGYADLEAVEASINDCEVFRYLMKPCPSDELSSAIESALKLRRNPKPQPAQLIEFPGARRKVQPDQPVTPGNSRKVSGVPEHNSVQRAAAANRHGAPTLVLSRDNNLLKMIRATAGAEVTKSADVDSALALVGKQETGVIVIDAETLPGGIEASARRMKTAAPDSVLLVASPRGDAALLINLINAGDIYRFMLKPVAAGQCRLWLDSAARHYQQLAPERGSRPNGAAPMSTSALSWLAAAWRRFCGTDS